MTLAAGTLLGHFEVVAPLGAGGMGEVFRARDTRLGRDVAIKALPAVFAQDPERAARFEREAMFGPYWISRVDKSSNYHLAELLLFVL